MKGWYNPETSVITKLVGAVIYTVLAGIFVLVGIAINDAGQKGIALIPFGVGVLATLLGMAKLWEAAIQATMES